MKRTPQALERARKYYETHKEACRERMRKWRSLNSEKVKKYSQEYYQKHKEQIRKHNADYYQRHREKCLETHKAWARKNKTKVHSYNENYRRRLRSQVLALLGNRCSNPKCLVPGGCQDPDCLQIDHVHGNGAEERRLLRQKSGIKYLKYILQKIQGGNKDYQLLCANCNMKKRVLNHEN